jgi:hypothetical protein
VSHRAHSHIQPIPGGVASYRWISLEQRLLPAKAQDLLVCPKGASMSHAQTLRRWFISPLASWRKLFTPHRIQPFRYAKSASRLGVEVLEDRTLLSVTASFLNPTWVNEGPTNLGTTANSITSVAYDPLNDAVLAGTQANGSVQHASQSGATWTAMSTGVNNTEAVGVEGSNVWHYSLSNNFSGFTRSEYDSSGNLITTQTVQLAATAGGAALSGLNSLDQSFTGGANIPFALNANDPTQMLIALNGIYEFADRGDTLLQQILPPTGQQFQGGLFTAVAYGGTSSNDTPNNNVVYAAAGNMIYELDGAGDQFSRSFALPTGTVVQSISIDPDNCNIAYAVDGNHVWATVDAGAQWTNISGSLTPNDANGLNTVQAVDFAASATQSARDVLLVGGRDGVFIASNPIGTPGQTANPVQNLLWTQLGSNLPSTPVTDLQYVGPTTANGSPAGDVLVVGTQGSGVWEIRNASTYLDNTPVLQITDDSAPSNINLVPDATNPANVDVLVNGQNIGQYNGQSLSQIQVTGGSGNINLSVEGGIALAGGITFTGGTGCNTLVVTGQDGDALSRQDAAPNGEVVVTGPTGTLTINFTGVNSVQTNGFNPTASNTAMAAGLAALGNWSGPQDAFANTTLPIVGSLQQALGNTQAIGQSGSGSGTSSNQNAVGLLQRIFDAAGIDLNNVASPDVTNLSTASTQCYSIEADTTLSGGNDLAMSVFGGAFNLTGNVTVSFDVHLHMIVGVDSRGFFIEPNTDVSDPELTISNLQITGNVNGDGAFGLLGVGLNNASLAANFSLQLTLMAPTSDPLTGATDGLIRLYDFGIGSLNLATVQLVSGNASNPTVNDLVLTGDLTASAAGANISYPINLTWANLLSGNLPELSGSGATQLESVLVSTNNALTTGLNQLSSFANTISQSSVLTTPIPILPTPATRPMSRSTAT